MNHKWEAEKKLYTGERNSLDGSHEKAEIQRKALIRGNNLAFSKETCLEKERVRSKVTPKKGDQNSNLGQAKPMALDSNGE